MASKKKIVKPDYMGSLADYKASVGQPRSNTPAPPPPSKKETTARDYVNALKAYLVLLEERRNKSNSPSFSTRDTVNSVTTYVTGMRYKNAIKGSDWFGPSAKEIRKQDEARLKEAEARVKFLSPKKTLPNKRIAP